MFKHTWNIYKNLLWIRSLRKSQQITKTTPLYAHKAGKLKSIVPPNYLETRKQTTTKNPHHYQHTHPYAHARAGAHSHTHTSKSFLGERNLNENKKYL